MLSEFDLKADRFALDQADQLLQLGAVQIGHSPIVHSRTGPMNHVIALPRPLAAVMAALCSHRPYEYVDGVLSMLIDHHSNGAVIKIIEATANQREAFARQVFDRRRKIELAIEP